MLSDNHKKKSSFLNEEKIKKHFAKAKNFEVKFMKKIVQQLLHNFQTNDLKFRTN